MKKKLLSLFGALVAALSFAVISPDIAHAGSYCNPPTYSRSGDLVTWKSYGSGNGYHRVRVYRSFGWYYGPWVYGGGYSLVTISGGNTSGIGVGSCQVY